MSSSIKQKRLEAIIRRDISEIIQYDLKDPSVGFITVTDVKVSNDHSYATVYVTFMGRNYKKKEGMEALERARGFIRSQLAARLDIRRTPELIFKIDEAEENGRRIDEILEQIHAQEKEKQKETE
jgi:ribosome-binding factor A